MRRFILATGLIFALAGPALAAGPHDGSWGGTLTCKFDREWSSRAQLTVKDNFARMDHLMPARLKRQGRSGEFLRRLSGTVNDDGTVTLDGFSVGPRGRGQFRIKGRFNGDVFRGEGGMGRKGRCKLSLLRTGTPPGRQAGRADYLTEAEVFGTKTPQTAGTGGELKQQLTVLKGLKDDGLISDLEYGSRKTALLDRFLKMKQAAAPPVRPKEAAKAVDQAKLQTYAKIDFGTYHALVIGNNKYDYLPDLKTARNDATTIAKVLKEDYGFAVTLLTDARHEEILDALDVYRETLGDSDNLLIYYAGHGWLDEAAEQGYWLPVDAKENRRSKWISNTAISTTLKALEAKHVMVVADSCYAGTLVRGLKITSRTANYIQRMAEKRARVVLTSGGLEPVADLGGSGHSPFAKAFLDVLAANDSVIDGNALFGQVRRSVMLQADQTPEYSDVRKAGHDGGDFLFVRRR